MKLFAVPAFAFLLFSFSAFAADDTTKFKSLHPQTPSNVQIINGKKFFSLNGARRFSGSTDNPAALAVMHHPRGAGGTVSRHATALPRFQGDEPDTKNKNNNNPILSVFAPEESHSR